MDNWKRIEDPANALAGRLGGRGTIAQHGGGRPADARGDPGRAERPLRPVRRRNAFNYVASAEAVAAGHDFANDPVGRRAVPARGVGP